ncbi:MAG: hypothetical protein WCA35_07115 [Kovacikia sp.]
MKRFLTVFVAIGWGMFAGQAVLAQQVPQASSSVRLAQVGSHSSKLVDPGDRTIQRSGASLVAETGVRPCPADICREVRPSTTNLNFNFYPDSTLRDPLFYRTDTAEAGILGRSSPYVYRNNVLHSLFPIDEADASTELGLYVQANF